MGNFLSRLPAEVIANAFEISREIASRLKQESTQTLPLVEVVGSLLQLVPNQEDSSDSSGE
ncbi:hypothetical protein PEC730217_09460 [Pectobacterium carotovorum subsp. carotovorum]|nr:hypothetical protein PEC730217_09460 [Pectobacterium carotovorum subsp. carotovorum]